MTRDAWAGSGAHRITSTATTFASSSPASTELQTETKTTLSGLESTSNLKLEQIRTYLHLCHRPRFSPSGPETATVMNQVFAGVFGEAWNPDGLQYDRIGAAWRASNEGGRIAQLWANVKA
ncbi:hypothetical protein MBLNU230_g8628t1 [Neophaeotheca triangularis]